MVNDGQVYNADSFAKYTSHPANRADDSKLQEKFGGIPHPQHPPPPPPPGAQPGGDDRSKGNLYKYTRSTANPYRTATIDRSKLSDLSGKYG